MADQKEQSTESPYMSPKELSRRWRCSRSSVDRIARRGGLTRLHLGEGQNGIVRYLRGEVVALEDALLHAETGKIISGKASDCGLTI